MSDLDVEIRGEILTLLPERAAYWAARETLLIADPHFGKAAAFRASGIPVPSGTTGNALARLQSAALRTGARRIAFLGDLLHAKEGRSSSMLDALGGWRRANPNIDVVLVRGNHDRRAGDPPAELRFECVDAPHLDEPFLLAHHPAPSPRGYVIAGHVHPGVRLYGTGRQRERLPCFVVGQDVAVLPAFGDFTGLAPFDPETGAHVYAVAGDEVVKL